MRSWFFPKQSSIQKFVSSENKSDIANNLKAKLNSIDKKIAEVTQELLQAQAVAIKSSLSTQSGWLGSMQQKWYGSTAQESIKWHRDLLSRLYKQRRQLQIQFEIETGQFWKNQIRRFLLLIIFGMILLLGICIVVMGLMTALYLLPIWGSIVILYFVIKKRSIRNF